jgi:hypothetical protein
MRISSLAQECFEWNQGIAETSECPDNGENEIEAINDHLQIP